LLILMTSVPPPGSAESVIPSGYRLVAEAHGIPSAVFYAVALAESGTRVDALGAVRPWPWTLNVQGDGRFYPSRRAATLVFEDALASGRTSVDVGLMQVNWRYHRQALGPVAGALDPYRNLDVAAASLTACHETHRDWWAAVGCYHAPNDPARAERYRDRVRRLWRGLQVQQ
jgi:soluble lytic murein transglycosylase-like protein